MLQWSIFQTSERTHLPRRPCFVLCTLFEKWDGIWSGDIAESKPELVSRDWFHLYAIGSHANLTSFLIIIVIRRQPILNTIPFLGPSPRCQHFSWGLSYIHDHIVEAGQILKILLYWPKGSLKFLHDDDDDDDDDEVETGWEF